MDCIVFSKNTNGADLLLFATRGYVYINYYYFEIRSASEGNAHEQRPEHIGSHVVVTAGTHELTVADIHLISNPNGWINDKVYLPSLA